MNATNGQESRPAMAPRAHPRSATIGIIAIVMGCTPKRADCAVPSKRSPKAEPIEKPLSRHRPNRSSDLPASIHSVAETKAVASAVATEYRLMYKALTSAVNQYSAVAANEPAAIPTNNLIR